MLMISSTIRAKERLSSWTSTRLFTYRGLRSWFEMNVAVLLLLLLFCSGGFRTILIGAKFKCVRKILLLDIFISGQPNMSPYCFLGIPRSNF